MKNVIPLPVSVENQDDLIDHFYTLELVPFARPALSAQMKYTSMKYFHSVYKPKEAYCVCIEGILAENKYNVTHINPWERSFYFH